MDFHRAVISEFGAGNNENCFNVRTHILNTRHKLIRLQFVDDMLQYLEANDVYIGWSAWAAGPRKCFPPIPLSPYPLSRRREGKNKGVLYIHICMPDMGAKK